MLLILLRYKYKYKLIGYKYQIRKNGKRETYGTQKGTITP